MVRTKRWKYVHFDDLPPQLFDLETDPDEMRNLAVEPRKHGELLLAMNDKMNALIETEVDEPDDGSFLPGEEANWAATRFDP